MHLEQRANPVHISRSCSEGTNRCRHWNGALALRSPLHQSSRQIIASRLSPFFCDVFQHEGSALPALRRSLPSTSTGRSWRASRRRRRRCPSRCRTSRRKAKWPRRRAKSRAPSRLRPGRNQVRQGRNELVHATASFRCCVVVALLTNLNQMPRAVLVASQKRKSH